ncbi:MAG: phosphodiester glycosidase family protein [Clostridia bacterium]|nr:phosphodiester glycosidase family protein [Clostridia bacterium]
MKKTILLFGLIVVLLLGCQPEQSERKAVAPTALASTAANTPAPTVQEASPTPTVQASPTPSPTATATPVPTREPLPGDVTDHFPTEDTGLTAQYSYQSDELRIAIDVVEDEELLQKYYVADIWTRNIHSFRTGFGHGKFGSGTEDGEAFAIREHAILAVNGTMNYGLIYHNGQKFRGYSSSITRKGIAVLFADGTMQLFDSVNLPKEIAQRDDIVHVLHYGPILVTGGEMAKDFPLRAGRHPRIMLGYYEPGHYVLVAVDGRSKTALGMTEREMAELMLSLGCQEAINLDGGTSAMMVFMGDCISHPSGKDNDGDGKAGRKLKDMLLFAEYDENGIAPPLEEVDKDRVTAP